MNNRLRPTDDVLEHCKRALAESNLLAVDTLVRRLLSEYPALGDGYNLLGNVAIREGEPRSAVRWFSFATVLAVKGDGASPWVNLGMALEMEGRLAGAAEAYRHSLEIDPTRAKVRGNLARVQFNMNAFAECHDTLLGLSQLTFDQYFMRGRCRLELRQGAKAITDLREALALRPAYTEAHRALGQALAQVGRHQEALEILLPMHAQSPGDTDLNYALGRIYYDLKQLERSKTFLLAAIDDSRHRFEANRHLGIVYRSLGDNGAAVPYLWKALELNPNDYHSFDHLGEALVGLDRLEDLEKLVNFTLEQAPDNPAIWNGAGIFLKAAGNTERAIELSKAAAEKYPDQPVILFNLAHMMNETTLAEEAEPFVKRALILQPDYAKAWNTLCVSYCMPYRHVEARCAVYRSLMINDQQASAWLNVGVLERSACRFTESIWAMRKAVRLNSSDTTAQTNLAYALLMAGEIEQGFRQYDKRWDNPTFPSARRPFPQPIWSGRKLKGQNKTLALYMEQGMGDEIMFSWFLPLVARRVDNLLVECDYRLVNLFKRSFPEFEYIARSQPINERTQSPEIAFKTPVGHVPKHFWFEIREHMNQVWSTATRPIVRTTGYLRADPDRRAHWRAHLKSFAPNRVRVGICWRSSVHNRARDLQYLTPEDIADCFDDRFAVINLQYDHLLEETDVLERKGAKHGYLFETPPGIDLRDDLDDLTALCAECDLVVTPLISTAFMAASVGTPTWVFRSSDCGRIWQQLGSPFVPWLPSLRLFFRFPTDPWSETISRMRTALSEVCEMGPEPYRSVLDPDPTFLR
ncbi:MAG: hypothetical protein CMM47_04030 [Rhodospirillaceae bacterium]|nr:hypothetical protein [Rhodospirillaceae bacterium]